MECDIIGGKTTPLTFHWLRNIDRSISHSQFFLSQDRVLCRYWPQKTDHEAQFVITESYVPVVLKPVHDVVMAGHPEKERTLSAARRSYYWPTMRVDIEAYVVRCVICAHTRERCLNRHGF